ncbi:MAG: sulfurtransferase complex subunit TusB [Pseudomonadales bacterium]
MPSGTLHILNKGLNAHELYQACYNSLSPQDSILLIENAVSACCDKQNAQLLAVPVQVYALEADLHARGLEAQAREECAIKVTDDAGFVVLCTQHTKTLSWF